MIEGIGASPGIAEGKVKWVNTKEDFDNFQTGEILFAKMTSPDWGEIFQKAVQLSLQNKGECYVMLLLLQEKMVFPQ